MLVVFSASHNDIHRTRDLLVWCGELDASLSNHRYLIVASSRVSNDEAMQLNALAGKLFFGGCVIKQRSENEQGWPMAANMMFKMASDWVMQNNAGHWLWIESDASPLKPGWLDTLDAEYRRCGKPFLGTVYDHTIKHMNGVAVYPQDIQSHHPFMLHASNIPWDCIRPDITMKKGHNTPLIQRMLADHRSNTPMSFPDVQSLGVIRSECVLFHGCKDGTLLARLREHHKLTAPPPPKPHPIPKLLKKTKLVVVLPFCNKDARVALNTLQWIHELNGSERHDNLIVLSYDAATVPEFVDQIKAAAKQAFKHVQTTSYESPLPGQLPQTMAFKHAANYIASKVKKSWIWLEADMVPIRHGWIDTLQGEYFFTPKQFMGSIVAGKGHCNGTAIYPANATEYICDALKMTWTAWDTAMKKEMIDQCHDASHLMQHVWGVVNGKFHPFGGQSPDFSDASLLNQIDPQAVVFHREKRGTLISALRTLGLPKTHPMRTVPKSMGTEIMIVSYHKDVQWLKYCLASIKKFASGFSGVTILVPIQDVPLFDWIAKEYPDMLLLDYGIPADKNLWHVAHQLQKFKADEWCPNAEFICHLDSDCIFTEPVTPNDYFVKGKPVLWIEDFARTGGPWKPTVERALGIPVKYDTMRHHPAVHYRSLYADTRARVSKQHNMEFDKYVMGCPTASRTTTASWGISEFEVLGNVALLPPWDTRYHFVDLEKVPRPVEKVCQMWSIAPIDAEQPLPSTGQKLVPRELFRKLGLEVLA